MMVTFRGNLIPKKRNLIYYRINQQEIMSVAIKISGLHIERNHYFYILLSCDNPQIQHKQ